MTAQTDPQQAFNALVDASKRLIVTWAKPEHSSALASVAEAAEAFGQVALDVTGRANRRAALELAWSELATWPEGAKMLDGRTVSSLIAAAKAALSERAAA